MKLCRSAEWFVALVSRTARCSLKFRPSFLPSGRFSLVAAVLLVAFSGCKNANDGQSAANESPVVDGEIVFVRRSNEVAAFILSNQRISPEQTDYTWFYRSDGKGTFLPNDPAVSTGSVSNSTKVAFSTFSIAWSINGNRRGWVYYSSGPVELSKQPDFAMCVTTETNLAKVDANDRRWRFRGRPSVNIRALLKSQVTDRIFGKGTKPSTSTGSIGFRFAVALVFGAVCIGGMLWWLAVRRREK